MINRLLYILLLMAVVTVCSCSSDSPYNFEPRLQTFPATDISRTEATLSGKCVKDKGVDMPSLWFSYGNDESMSERQEVLADADGNVSMHLSSLNAGTTYYYMLHGTNGSASLSGEMVSFATQPNQRPTVSKAEVLSSAPVSLIVGYSITDNGGTPVTSCGCRVSGEGIEGGEKTIMQSGEADDKGMYSLFIDGLQSNITYTIKPFAVNNVGESEGEAIQFTTSSAVVLGKAG
ncbi:hypothetical protein, partial [uncultured Prevotella sp.]|uniref:hypothetical protein n=1 Tax=uncultured Prevotella sp. TaxID=159272 RepID=UPI00266FCDA0